MQTNPFSTESTRTTYSGLLRELVTAVTDLVKNEVTLAKEEAKETGARLARHAAQAALFGSLLALSALPFLAFLVIGLGDLLEGRYWLSSLIVALLCAGVGGAFAYRAFKKITDGDLDLPHTRRTLEREKAVISSRLEEVKDATQRRAV